MRSVLFSTFASTAVLGGFVAAESIRVIDADFPDPCIIQADNGYYAFATTGNGVNVQVASSQDFASWERLSGLDALPGPFPSWVAESPAVWAPDVIQRVSFLQSLRHHSKS